MAHIIDLTLFYGGIASAPTAELPFAGSSFDVQEGTLRRAVFGVLEAVSRADVRPAGIDGRKAQTGAPSVLYGAQASLDGFVRHAGFGDAHARTAKEVFAGGISRSASFGVYRVATSATASVAGIANAHTLGLLDVVPAVTIHFDGVARIEAVGRPLVEKEALAEPDGFVGSEHTVGSALALSAVRFDVQSAKSSPIAFGGITVSTAADIRTRGFVESATVGLPRCAIRVFPASVEYAADLGVPFVHSSTTVVLASAPLRMPTVGRTTTRTAVSVRAQSAGGRNAELGKVLVATSADVALAGIRQAWTTGRPSVAIRVFPAGMRLTAGYGRPTASSVRNVSVRGIAGNAPTHGATRFVSAVTLRVPGVGRKPVGSGLIAVTTEAHARPRGFVESMGFGRPSLAIAIAPSSVPHASAIGDMRLVPAHTAKLEGFAASPSAGLPFVGFGLVVAPAGLVAQARDFGTATFAWRKCPRFDRSAVLMQESEVDARIRPAPTMPQVWRGEVRIRRDCHMDAVLARVLERRTVARLKNEARAAVCRKEQI